MQGQWQILDTVLPTAMFDKGDDWFYMFTVKASTVLPSVMCEKEDKCRVTL